MKHDAAHYEAMALGVFERMVEAGTIAPNFALVNASMANAYATLAVAAATLEASRTTYPANHPLAQEAT